MTSLVTVGRILRPHGLNGAVRILLLTEDVEKLLREKELVVGPELGEGVSQTVIECRAVLNGVLIRFEGIGDRDAADKLRGKFIKALWDEPAPLASDTYYVREIIGVRVETEEGEYVGDCEDVLRTGSNDVYIIRHPETRKDWMVPALHTAIVQIDMERRLMIVRKDWMT